MTNMMTTIELDDDFDKDNNDSSQSTNNQSKYPSLDLTNHPNNPTTINHTIPTVEEKNALFEAISDDSVIEPDLSEDNLVETEDDSHSSKWSNSKYTQIVIIAVVFSVICFVGAGAFGLFSFFTQPNISRNVPDIDNSELDEDPTQDAITEAENSKARLILLGESVDSRPPKQKLKEVDAQTQTPPNQPTSTTPTTATPTTATPTTATPTTSTPTSSSRSSDPAPTTVARVSTPPPPLRTRRSGPPPTPTTTSTPTTSTIATQPSKKVIDRQALSQRGWSGFAQVAHNLTQPQPQSSAETPPENNAYSQPQPPTPNTQPSNPQPSNPQQTEPIPVIRLVMGDSTPNPQWQFQSVPEQTSLQSGQQNGDSTRENIQSSLNNFQPVKLNDPNDISTLLGANKLSLTQTLQHNNIELPLTSQDNLNSLHGQLPQTFPKGTQLNGQLTTPIVHTLNSSPNNNNNANSTFTYPFSIVVTQDLLNHTGKTALPAGTLMMGRVVSLTPSGMIHAEITSISYKKQGQPFSVSIPPGQILVLSENSQPLKAQRLNDPSGAIASQDFLVGTLGAAATGLEYANQPQTQTSIQQNGFGGFNSSSTTTNQDVGLIPGLAEGFFNTLKGRMESRADTAIAEYQRQVPEYYVPANTNVTLFFNAVLEIVP